MKQLILTFCMVTIAANVFAAGESLEHFWKQANHAYAQKQYDSSAGYYSKILEREPTNALVYYNLGNAYYKSNKIGLAVLNYERALFFNPALNIAQDNLLLAKSRIPNAIKQRKNIFFIDWWNVATSGNTATQWAVSSLLVFLAFLAIILQRIRKKDHSKVPAQAFFLIPVLLIILVFCSFTAAYNASHSNKAVTMHTATTMTLAPDNYKGQLIIPEATTVRTGISKGNWIAVTLPDNREGWVQKAELTRVVPVFKK